jgi:hypothetical protein
MGGSGGVGAGSAHPLPAENALFVEDVCPPVSIETPKKASIAQNQNFPQKRHSFIAQNQQFSPTFLQLGKTWNLIPRCQENAYIST